MPGEYLVDEFGNPINNLNPLPTSLTGRKAQEILFHNAVAITDTANKDIGPTDVSALSGRKAILVKNTLNQQVTLTVYAVSADSTLDFAVLGTINVSAGVFILVSSNGGSPTIPGLADPMSKIRIRAACTVAPTSGSLTVILTGVTA